MKKLKWIVLGLLIGAVVCVFVVLTNIDGIVRRAVETQSTASLGLESKLGGANVSLLGGSVKLSDFAVASPPGFAAGPMVQVGGLGLEVSLSELRQDPLRVGNITVSKPRLVLEQKDLKLNLKAALDQLPPTQSGAKEPVKLIVGEVRVEDAVVVIRPGIPGLGEELTIPLGSMVVKDIGTGDGAKNGVAIKEVLLAVATAMADKAMDSDKIPPEVRALLKGDLSGLKDRVGAEVQKGLDTVRKQGAEQVEKAKDEAKKGIEKGLDNLLGGKK